MSLDPLLGGLGGALLRVVAASQALPDRARPKKMRIEPVETVRTPLANAWPWLRRRLGLPHRQVPFSTDLPTEVAGQMVRLILGRGQRERRASIEVHRLVDWWIQVIEPAALIDTVLVAADIELSHPTGSNRPSAHPLTRLRIRLSAQPAEWWATARRRAQERVAEGLTARQTLTLAYLFPEEPKWSALAFATWQPIRRWGWPGTPPQYALLACAHTPAQIAGAAQIIRHQPREHRTLALWTVVARSDAPMLDTLQGISLDQALRACLTTDSAEARQVAWGMALKVDPAATFAGLTALPESLHDEARTFATAALENPKRKVERAFGALPEASRRLLSDPRSLADMPVSVEVIPPALRPEALIARAAIPEPTTVPPIEEMRWRDGERDAWLVLDERSPPDDVNGYVDRIVKRFDFPPVVARLVETDDPEALAALRRGGRRLGAMIGLWEFQYLPRRFALHLWNALPPAITIGTNADGLQWWLATIELDAMRVLLRFIDEAPEAAYDAAMPFASYRIAQRAVAHLDAGVERASPAQRWVLRHSDVTARWLIPRLVGAADADEQAMARRALSFLLAHERIEAVRAEARLRGPAGEALIQAIESGWTVQTRPRKVQAPPKWWGQVKPAPVLATGEALPKASFEVLRALMTFGSAQMPYVGLRDAYAALDQGSLKTFLHALLVAWDAAGRRKPYDWVLSAISITRDVGLADALGARVVGWAAQRNAAAIKGIEAVGRMATGWAIQHLGEIAERWRHGKMGRQAQIQLRFIAREQGLDAHQLDDRTQPTGRYDASGMMRFDFGPRAFYLRLDGQLRAGFFDDAGQALKSLPRLRKSDDPAIAPAAHTRLKAARKGAELARIRRSTLTRLRRLRGAGGIWRPPDFSRFVVEHPILGRVAPGLAFGVFRDGELVEGAWLVEGRLVTAERAAIELTPDDRVGLAHPYDLGTDRTAALRRAMESAGRVPIIELLTRGAMKPDDEAIGKVLPGLVDLRVPARRLNALIAEGIWFAYDPHEDRYGAVARAIPGGWVVLDLDFGPMIPRWGADDDSEHTVRRVVLQGTGLTFEALPGRLVCEVINDVQTLVAS